MLRLDPHVLEQQFALALLTPKQGQRAHPLEAWAVAGDQQHRQRLLQRAIGSARDNSGEVGPAGPADEPLAGVQRPVIALPLGVAGHGCRDRADAVRLAHGVTRHPLTAQQRQQVAFA